MSQPSASSQEQGLPIKETVSKNSSLFAETDAVLTSEDILKDELPYEDYSGDKSVEKPARKPVSFGARKLAPYETEGVPAGFDSSSPEWMFECEVRQLTMMSATKRLDFLSGIAGRRGKEFAERLGVAIERRLLLMKQLSIGHPRIDVKKAEEFIGKRTETERPESYTRRGNSESDKPQRKKFA